VEFHQFNGPVLLVVPARHGLVRLPGPHGVGGRAIGLEGGAMPRGRTDQEAWAP